jgi:UDP-N-acetylglucosamine 3-dehydrogenase
LSDTLRMIVVGGGGIAREHARALIHIKETTLVGVVDPYRRQLADALNVRWFPALDDVPATAYDAMDLCVPSYLHKAYVLEAARLGKAVFSEKPLALTLADAEAMIEAMQAKRLPFGVGQVVRFFPEYVAAKTLVDQGALGRVAVARLARVGQRPKGWNDWYLNRRLSGGTLFDLAIHDLDFIRWALGPVERVYAKQLNDEMSGVDMTVVTLRCENGTLAHVEASWAHTGFTTAFELAGSEGLVRHNRPAEHPLQWLRRDAAEAAVAVAIPDSAPSAISPYQRELQAWVDSVLQGEPVPVSGDDAYQTLKVAVAAQRSIETRQPVRVATVD